MGTSIDRHSPGSAGAPRPTATVVSYEAEVVAVDWTRKRVTVKLIGRSDGQAYECRMARTLFTKDLRTLPETVVGGPHNHYGTPTVTGPTVTPVTVIIGGQSLAGYTGPNGEPIEGVSTIPGGLPSGGEPGETQGGGQHPHQPHTHRLQEDLKPGDRVLVLPLGGQKDTFVVVDWLA